MSFEHAIKQAAQRMPPVEIEVSRVSDLSEPAWRLIRERGWVKRDRGNVLFWNLPRILEGRP